MLSSSEALRHARTIVVKVGSSLVADGRIFGEDGVAADIIKLRSKIVLVSSGAVALGRRAAPDIQGDSLAERQALSAIGQTLLMRAWREAFERHGRGVAQILLTPDVTTDSQRADNARATLTTLIASGRVPIINENDTVATEELRYGDNDRLAAQTAGLIGADLLVLLSDVDGFYDKDPRHHADAQHAQMIDAQTLADPSKVAPSDPGALGTGGMRSKLEAASLATSFGIKTIIASGQCTHPLSSVLEGTAKSSLALPSG